MHDAQSIRNSGSLFTQNVVVCFRSRDVPTTVKTFGRDLITGFLVLIHPWHLKPAARIGFVGSEQMKSFRIDSDWVPERLHMAGQQEVEGLEPITVIFSTIQPCQ